MFQHPKCYAKSLKDCSTLISKEHYISEGVLKIIGPNFEVSGLPWLNGKTKALRSSALATNILCNKHNTQLSKIDRVAINFLKTLKRFNEELNPIRNSISEKMIFSGHNLERWFIKLYLGMQFSGQFALNGSILKRDVSDQYLIDFIFNKCPLPQNLGFHFGENLGSTIYTYNGLSITPFIENGGVTCFVCELLGFKFFISLKVSQSVLIAKKLKPYQHHPLGIDLNSYNNTISKSIIFEW